MIVHTSEKFEIWNLKDKVLVRNVEIDEAPGIQGFWANSMRKIVVHFTRNTVRVWNYANGLILKTFRTPVPIVWVNVDAQAKYLRSLDIEGNFITRCIDFSDFIKLFQGVCIPNQISVTDQRQEHNEQITLYVKYGRQLIQNLNQYRLNEQQKKVSLQKMYRLAQTIKTSLFYQDKEDVKVIFTYLNSIKQSEDKSSRINAHSEEYVFTSHREEFVTAVSNVVDGSWLIGGSDGTIRLVSAPDKVHLTIKPKNMPVLYLYLQPTSFFIGYNGTCFLIQRQNLSIVVTHSAYHKKPIRMGLVLSSVLVTGDQDEIILFWNKQKIRRYRIPVNLGDIVGKRLIIAGFDNRVRIYQMHPDNGLQKQHVFVGHVQNIYNMVVIDDGIFTTYSYDGTIRWWSAQAKNCFSYYNFKKYFKGDKILCVDMPKFSMEEEKHARFDREGCALVLLNGNDVVVFDTMRKEIKWRLEMKEEVLKVFWTSYPNQFAAVMHEEIVIINVYWRYMVLKK